MSDGRVADADGIAAGMAAGMAALNDSSGVTHIPTTFDNTSKTAGRPAFLDIVPAEYKDKPWVQDAARADDPYSAFFKTFESAQSKLGERVPGIQRPGENASPDEIKAFYKALGAPEDVKGYSYNGPDLSKEPEQIQQVVANMRDESLLNALKEQALAEGLTEKQFNALAAKFDNLQLERVKAMVDGAAGAGQERMEAQKKILSQQYGDKAEQVQRVAKETALKVIPEAIRNSGDMELGLLEALRYIHENVFKNDSIGGGGQPGAPALTAKDVRAQIDEMRKDPRFTNKFMHGSDEFRTEVNKMYHLLIQKQNEEAGRNKA